MERYKLKMRELQISLPLGTTVRGNKKSLADRRTLSSFKDVVKKTKDFCSMKAHP